MRRTVRAAAGAALTVALTRAFAARWPGGSQRWERVNHRGGPVTLLAGPVAATAAGLTASTGAAGAVAALGAGAVGVYDDLVGGRPDQRASKGLRGHAQAAARGQLTTGAVKVAGIGVTGLLAARLAGRALKVALASSLVVDEPGTAAVAAALLPADLAERAMLGDGGANALGAVLGLAAARRLGSRRRRGGALAVLVGLTAASEVVSFTRVIDAVPPLRAVDRLGRLP